MHAIHQCVLIETITLSDRDGDPGVQIKDPPPLPGSEVRWVLDEC